VEWPHLRRRARRLLLRHRRPLSDLLLAALVRATPLLIIGLAVLIAFRAGIWNIGAEGQFYAGAIVATWIGTRWGLTSPLAAVVLVGLGAAVAGAAWAAVPAWLRSRFGVLEVITTIMLNFIAEYLVGFLVQGPLQEAGHTYPQSDPVAAATRLAPLVEGTRLTLAFPLGVVLALAAWVFLMRTRPGFALRAAGANPVAARVSGRINVGRVMTMALLASGALAGLAGAAEVCGVTFALYERLSPGYGYSAIAVALLARLNPLAVIPTALFFGFLEAGASALQRSAGIPSVTVYAVEGLVILVVVALERRLRSSADA
jgi:simple sugar transport system permease protein